MKMRRLCRLLGLNMVLFGIVSGTLGTRIAAPALATPFESPLESPAASLALTPRAYLPFVTRPSQLCLHSNGRELWHTRADRSGGR